MASTIVIGLSIVRDKVYSSVRSPNTLFLVPLHLLLLLLMFPREMLNPAVFTLALLPWMANAASSFRQSDFISCGVRGYNQATDAYRYTPNPKLANYASCSRSCNKSTRCKSFALGSGACLLYSTTVYAIRRLEIH